MEKVQIRIYPILTIHSLCICHININSFFIHKNYHQPNQTIPLTSLPSISLSPWDFIVLTLYFIILFYLAFRVWWEQRKSSIQSTASSERNEAIKFFLASKSIPIYQIAFSLFVSNISTEHLIGLSATATQSGMLISWYEWTAPYLLVLLGWIFIPIYKGILDITTVSEYLEMRFDKRIRILYSMLMIILYCITKISISIFSAFLIIDFFLGWSMIPSILFILFSTAIYSLIGLKAIVVTEVMQTLVLITGGIILSSFGLYALGGVSNMFSVLPTNFSSLYRSPSCIDCEVPIGGVFGIIVASIYYWAADQLLVQRTLAAKSVNAARGGAIYAGFLKLLSPFLFVFPGIIAAAIYLPSTKFTNEAFSHEIQKLRISGGSNLLRDNPNYAFPLLAATILPPGLLGFVLAGALAAVMSSLASIFNSSATLISVDLLAWNKSNDPNLTNLDSDSDYSSSYPSYPGRLYRGSSSTLSAFSGVGSTSAVSRNDSRNSLHESIPTPNPATTAATAIDSLIASDSISSSTSIPVEFTSPNATASNQIPKDDIHTNSTMTNDPSSSLLAFPSSSPDGSDSIKNIHNSLASQSQVDLAVQLLQETEDQKLVKYGRFSVLLILVISLLWIPILSNNLLSDSIFISIQKQAGYLSPPISAIFIGSILSDTPNTIGAYWSFGIGTFFGIVRLVGEIILNGSIPQDSNTTIAEIDPTSTGTGPDSVGFFSLHYLYFTEISFIISLFVLYFVSFYTKHSHNVGHFASITWQQLSVSPWMFEDVIPEDQFHRAISISAVNNNNSPNLPNFLNHDNENSDNIEKHDRTTTTYTSSGGVDVPTTLDNRHPILILLHSTIANALYLKNQQRTTLILLFVTTSILIGFCFT